mmetsp:Transcript_55099/g.103312  ORF Transcript_55099/g.103312 Transcript_55099/m.103312 type:complete len:246 (-) Transcript_55099:65-802(-)
MDNQAMQTFQAQLAQALAFKLVEAQEAAAEAQYSAGMCMSSTSSECQDSASQSTPRSVSDDACRSQMPTSKPRFLDFSELSQIDWNRLAKLQEWRTALQLRGLPPKLCTKGAMEALLEAHGMQGDVAKVKTSLKPGARLGSAVLHANSAVAVRSLCRFFHGRQFAGSRVPVSVSFADGKTASRATVAKLPAKLAAPKRVDSEIFAAEGASGFLAPPPGLEDLAYASQISYLPAFGMHMPEARAHA